MRLIDKVVTGGQERLEHAYLIETDHSSLSDSRIIKMDKFGGSRLSHGHTIALALHEVE